jgi:hypothetical protein
MTIYIVTTEHTIENKRVYGAFDVFMEVKPTDKSIKLWTDTFKRLTSDPTALVKIRKRSIAWLNPSDQSLNCILDTSNGYMNFTNRSDGKWVKNKNKILKELTKEEYSTVENNDGTLRQTSETNLKLIPNPNERFSTAWNKLKM